MYGLAFSLCVSKQVQRTILGVTKIAEISIQKYISAR